MDRFDYTQIEHMTGGINRYVEHGIPMGDFLTAVFSNDLREACGRADDTNIELLPVFIAYMYNELPSGCWGSPEAVKTWLERFSHE